MKHRLLTFTSLLLCVATVAFWVMSYFQGWEIKTKGPTGPNGGIVNAIELGLDAISADGVLCIKYNICVWTVPFWKLAAVLFYVVVRARVPWPVITIRRPPNDNECSACRYDLTGNISGTCPECGSPIPKAIPDARGEYASLTQVAIEEQEPPACFRPCRVSTRAPRRSN